MTIMKSCCSIGIRTFLARGHLSLLKQEMLVAIIFGGFENITIWQRFNLEEVDVVHIMFI